MPLDKKHFFLRMDFLSPYTLSFLFLQLFGITAKLVACCLLCCQFIPFHEQYPITNVRRHLLFFSKKSPLTFFIKNITHSM